MKKQCKIKFKKVKKEHITGLTRDNQGVIINKLSPRGQAENQEVVEEKA